MSKKTHWKSGRLTPLALIGAAALMLTGCSSPAPGESEDPVVQNESSLFSQELHDSLPADVQESGKLRVASVLADQLFSFKDGSDVSGIIPALASEVGSVLGLEIEFVDTPFPGMIPAIQANRVDVIWSTMNDTVEREETLDFVDWVRTSSSFMVQPGNPHKIVGSESLCGLKAGTLRGAVPLVELLNAQSEECLAGGDKAIDIMLYDDFPSGLTQIRSGQIDAYFGPTEKFKFIIATSDEDRGFEVVDKSYLGGVFGIGVSKDKHELSEAVLAALKVLAEEGIYQDVLTDWQNGDHALTVDELQINGIGAGAFK